MGAALPKNVEVHASVLATDGAIYRSSDDGERRFVTVRGTNTTRNVVAVLGLVAGALVTSAIALSSRVYEPVGIVALVLVLMSVHLAPSLLARRMRRVRFVIGRRELVATTLPLGSTVRVEAWAASRPFTVERRTRTGTLTLVWWDVLVENEAGGRTLVATLTDEPSAEAVLSLLRERYRDAPPPSARNEVAKRFGPPPPSIAVHGDVASAGQARWTIHVTHTREGWLGTLTRTLFTGTLASIFLVAIVSLLASGGSEGPVSALVLGLLIFLPTGTSAVNGLRKLVMRLAGRAEIVLTPGELRARSHPLPTELLAPRGRTIVSPTEVRTRPDVRRGPTVVVKGVREQRVILRGFALDADEASYLARVIDAYYRARG